MTSRKTTRRVKKTDDHTNPVEVIVVVPPPDDDVDVVDVAMENRAYAGDVDDERETRGEKKRRAEKLERLGESLVKLPPVKLARVPLPDDLREAVDEAKRLVELGVRGGYRRQVQYIGKIMRTIDARPIAAAIDSLKVEDAPSAASFQKAELWRDRLVDGTDATLGELLKEHPGLDRTRARQLMRQAQVDAKVEKPKTAARALFRLLREQFVKDFGEASAEVSEE